MRLLIVGGVAGGASAAARARRLSETAQIIMFEKGKHVSFANCGMPYYLGGEITDERKLLVAPPKLLKERFGIDTRIESEIISINRQDKTVTVKNLIDSSIYIEKYDKLVLSPGAEPVKPPIEGIISPKIYTLRNLSDMESINSALNSGASIVTIIGGGFIGLEMAENMVKRGLKVNLIEGSNQLMPPLDPEMASVIMEGLTAHGVNVYLNSPALKFENSNGQLLTYISKDKSIQSDIAVVCVGVKPDSKLAKEAGLEIGGKGGILVNQNMRTSDKDIYAAGDSCEIRNIPLGFSSLIPLAGPANRQGRIAADNIFGIASSYRGTQGTSIVGVFGLLAATTGANEKSLKNTGINYEKVYVHANNHAGYYPGASMMTIKLIFEKENGRILGAQIVGAEGVDKRIDIISMAIQADMTVFSLEESELAYAPQFGSAKDPVNIAGFAAGNTIKGVSSIFHADTIPNECFILDVRTQTEFANGNIAGSYNIPVDELRQRLEELPKSKKIAIYCQAGLRGYIALRILQQNGFDCSNLSGGFKVYNMYKNAGIIQ